MTVTTLIATPDPEDGLSDAVKQEIKNLLHGELSNFLSDVEWRVKQAMESERAARSADDNVIHLDRQIRVEDMNTQTHQLTGFVLTSNSPGAGSIAWSSLHIVYGGVDYVAADGNTANRYVWFVKPGSGTAVTLQTSNTKPVLGPNDGLLFVNNNGTPVDMTKPTAMPQVVADGAIDGGAIQNGVVTAAKTDFAAGLATAITNAQNAADLAQATADGAIASYFQTTAPWANGSTQPVAKVGDLWFDQTTGNSYRWSGAAGTPANTWVEIVDNDVSAALTAANNANAKASIKTTTYYSVAATAPTAPTPPAGSGFTTGDFWVVTDLGNLIRRWSGSAWVDLSLGTGAITDGAITNVKVGTGIDGAKLAGGTVGNTQLGTNAVTPTKLNILSHLLY